MINNRCCQCCTADAICFTDLFKQIEELKKELEEQKEKYEDLNRSFISYSEYTER